MNVIEIIEELPHLSLTDQNLIQECLNELQTESIEETPGMLAAVDKGIYSLERHGGIPIEVVQVRRDTKWSALGS